MKKFYKYKEISNVKEHGKNFLTFDSALCVMILSLYILRVNKECNCLPELWSLISPMLS